MKNFITKSNITAIAGIFLFFLVWEVISLIAGSEQIFPSPATTLVSLVKIFGREGFWASFLLTILRGLSGFLISLVLAFMIGIPAGLSRTFYLMVSPFIVTMRSVPVISLILLAIIWLGNENVPVFIALLTMFPIMVTNIIDGIKNVDRNLLEMGRVYGIKQSSKIKEISIPSILPFLFSGISSALGFGWRAIIIGEVLSQPKYGIGTEMQNAQIYLEVSELIAWTLLAVIISYIFEWSIRRVQKKIIIWK